MTSNTMNFGPEWMRRFPPKSAQSQNDLLPREPSPLQDWGQPPLTPMSGSGVLSSTGSATAGGAGSVSQPAFSYSSVAANNVRSATGPSSTSSSLLDNQLADAIPATDTLNPFKYSKEFMLSLFKPVGFPIEFERHEYATSEEALLPMSSHPFTDQELKILSGNVNSEVARRVIQPNDGGPQERERGQGQRRESVSNSDHHGKDRDHSGRHDRSDRPSHSRGHDSKYQGSGSRTR
ncbi:hypothetical protein BGW38_008393, partial [Lunasporangiospora selenospora]